MPIISYVPPIKKIVDHRNSEGGYYNAKCDICGTDFFPARRNAKYCSPNCGVVAHRQAVASGEVAKKTVKTIKNLEGVVCRGTEQTFDVISSECNTKGQKGTIISSLKALEVDDFYQFETVSIMKVSPGKYQVFV